MKRNKPLYIVVNPVGSKFAKSIQIALKNKVNNPVYRISYERAYQKRLRSAFWISDNPLNKIQQLTLLERNNVNHPAFCTSSEDLESLESDVVFARTLVNSTGGRGIVEFGYPTDNPPSAPLYTAYIKKKAEYRLHVFANKVIDAQQKRKKRGFDPGARNTRVRNLSNGYVYCRDNISLPDGIETLAIEAVRALEYVYGAVDIIYNEKQDKCYVLEVNSRPGLMGTTVDKYCDAIIDLHRLERK